MVEPIAPDVLAVARELAREGVERGALAVALAGSHARREARPESDIDLHFVGDGPEYELERREPFLVSLSWRSEEQHWASLRNPALVGGAVPGWRSAVILHDPHGIAARLQQAAREWTWEVIGAEALDAYAADGVSGLAEEVHKLVTNRDAGRLAAAAVQRSILAIRLAVYLGVHLRILHDSENHLWDLVNAALGDDWTRAQSAALGLDDESFAATCDAAVALFALACRRLWPRFDERQRAVVAHACRVAGRPVTQ